MLVPCSDRIASVDLNDEQGARQNLATIFASRTNSSRGRRPRVNKEEEVGGWI